MPTEDKFELDGHALHEVAFRSITEAFVGHGVQATGGMKVTATATDLEIQVAAGTVWYNGSDSSLGSSTTTTLSSGDGSNDRWDTVAWDTGTSSVNVREGTAESNPTPPDIGGDEILLAYVYVASGATDVGDDDIVNLRPRAREAVDTKYDDTAWTPSAATVKAALDELQEAAQISAYPLGPGDLDLGNGLEGDGAGSTRINPAGIAGTALAEESATALQVASGGVTTTELDLTIGPTWTGIHTYDTHQTWQEITTPSGSPATNYWRIYVKSDGNLYLQEDDGTESQVGGGGSPGGTDTQVQYNNGGSFGGTANLTWDDANDVLDASGAGLTLPTATTPGQTAEGRVVWDSDDDKLTVGDGAARATMVNEARSLTGGDGIGTIGDLSTDRTIAAALATSGGLKFASGEMAVEPADFAGTLLSDDGSDNLQVDEASISHDGIDQATVSSDDHHTRPTAGDGLTDDTDTFNVNVSDFAGEGLEDDGSDNLKVKEPVAYEPGHTEWEDGLSNEEIWRLVLQTGETLVVERLEFRQKGGGSSASASIDVRDTTAASTIGSQDLGGTTKDPGSSGAANTVIVRVNNSTGGAINAAPLVHGYIGGA